MRPKQQKWKPPKRNNMQVTAQLNNLRIAPRKVRLVAGLLKGKGVNAAQEQLNFLTKNAAQPLTKLLRSALNNAENNFGLLKENLLVKEIMVNEGMKLKRFRPKAMGQAAPIQKKTSRLTLVLEEKVPGLKAAPKRMGEKKEESVAREVKTEKIAIKEKPATEIKSKISQKGVFSDIKNISRKLFRRKSV